MNHQPFEEWLLEDKPLTPAEKREMDLHLRICPQCTALSATGLALRSARTLQPAPGFARRFEQRLAAQKITERRRRLWGMLTLIFTGSGLFGVIAAPYIRSLAASPVDWLTTAVTFFLSLFGSIEIMFEALGVLTRVLPDFVPPYMWMVMFSGMSGVLLLWSISLWRFVRQPQGVTA